MEFIWYIFMGIYNESVEYSTIWTMDHFQVPIRVI